MIISVYLPALVSLLLAGAIPVLAPRLPPSAARPVAAAAVTAALASAWAAGLLASALLREAPPVAEQARHAGMTWAGPVPGIVAAAAAAWLAAGGARLALAVRARVRTARGLARVCGSYPPGTELAVLASPAVDAFAVPGRPGMIAVTSGMLAALGPAEREVLLAHERAHLEHRHGRLRAAAEAAAAVSPLLIPARTAVAYLAERQADEQAAVRAGSRQLAARALARAALARTRQARGQPAFADLSVTRRVTALLAPPPPRRRPLAVLPLILAASSIWPAADATIAFAHQAARLLG